MYERLKSSFEKFMEVVYDKIGVEIGLGPA